MSSEFRDRLYWRLPKNSWTLHAFRRTDDHGRGYLSLCGSHFAKRIPGQACHRPALLSRCAICDNAEMALRGWDESGPVLTNDSKHWIEITTTTPA